MELSPHLLTGTLLIVCGLLAKRFPMLISGYNTMPEEKRKKLLVSFEECAGLTERELNCPYCDYPIDGVFSDATGHLRVKCQKCKANMVVSLAYFRRKRGYAVYKRYRLARERRKTATE